MAAELGIQLTGKLKTAGVLGRAMQSLETISCAGNIWEKSGQQRTIQLVPLVAGNAKCQFSKFKHHPAAVMNIFAPLIHQFGVMVYSNQKQVFQKRSKFIYTQGRVAGPGWEHSYR
jgi:hypothetical protein